MTKTRMRSLLLGAIGVVGLVLTAPVTAVAASYTLVGWNNLGMHCMDDDFSVFSLLPPYNTIHAQLIDPTGTRITNPRRGDTDANAPAPHPVPSGAAERVPYRQPGDPPDQDQRDGQPQQARLQAQQGSIDDVDRARQPHYIDGVRPVPVRLHRNRPGSARRGRGAL